ncbi:DUF2061 domain-containing protein [Psychroserpens sp.]|uniref:DUF2061 domain-containing protein n=1 Tax=Psychroserpens sp. TaxID=2020870 RepID=UPI001B053528|nr:DUF2061 domain-containing protein [Psychroserpens sp.]MBO6605382.1 DUF2061 domain-containing protein [Psychroserpens sp.]MBO6630517.1 DUF2061 domain-containing protein [Psychroserpens sp.]MBO6653809.1 DUF2061 domain-containing protein [Psychroserpens sp.]MBO6682130.1 DUF2061 domain-containing protein [Psychroserpens sp.]MBO6748756.1 DUF2061 domain-containing protein [Psychroserpens sp.]
MPKYKKESHIRSLLKGISWRVVATTDTVLVVLLITCLTGTCSLENALRIGGAEFIIKFLIYYAHERIWQFAYKDGVVSTKETLYKTISWRILATTMTFIISGAILESFDEVAFYIAITELFTKFILYYFHERLWLKLPLGQIRDYFKRLLKISNE